MSNCTKAVKRNIIKRALKFPSEMYDNIYGSLAICYAMMSKQDIMIAYIKKQWNIMKRTNKAPASIEDKDFIEKTAIYFGYEYDKSLNDYMALVVGKYNMLFAPYVDGHIMPLREDGLTGVTLQTGKVYPISNSIVDTVVDDTTCNSTTKMTVDTNTIKEQKHEAIHCE